MLTEMAAGKPDVIVFELGDGLLGTYGVRVDPAAARHQGRAHRRGAVRERSGGGLGRRQAAARALRHRPARGHRVPRPTTRWACRSSEEQMGVAAFNAHRQRRRRSATHLIAQARARATSRDAPEVAGAHERRALPAIVLGGTGYVAGELLRLIAGHPQPRARGRAVRQPARRAGRRRLPAPGERLPGRSIPARSRRSRR